MKKILVGLGVLSLLVWFSRSPPGDMDLTSAVDTFVDVFQTTANAVADFLSELFS